MASVQRAPNRSGMAPPPPPLTWVIPCRRDLALMLRDDAEKLDIRIGEVAARRSAAYGFRLISPQSNIEG
uniref:Uncharacterized protein n=1 Tax=Oryza meridionalis TaxID=40149 RepID=A0A0E0EK50_9ORYZ